VEKSKLRPEEFSDGARVRMGVCLIISQVPFTTSNPHSFNTRLKSQHLEIELGNKKGVLGATHNSQDMVTTQCPLNDGWKSKSSMYIAMEYYSVAKKRRARHWWLTPIIKLLGRLRPEDCRSRPAQKNSS
jgi:hypothetical protein